MTRITITDQSKQYILSANQIKKLSRKMRNRLSAQKSRERKKIYLTALEKKTKQLEGENIVLKRKLEKSKDDCNSKNSQIDNLKSRILELEKELKNKQETTSRNGEDLIESKENILEFCDKNLLENNNKLAQHLSKKIPTQSAELLERKSLQLDYLRVIVIVNLLFSLFLDMKMTKKSPNLYLKKKIILTNLLSFCIKNSYLIDPGGTDLK